MIHLVFGGLKTKVADNTHHYPRSLMYRNDHKPTVTFLCSTKSPSLSFGYTIFLYTKSVSVAFLELVKTKEEAYTIAPWVLNAHLPFVSL